MADKGKNSAWFEIDNTVIDVIGKRVFYQLTDIEMSRFSTNTRKVYGQVVGATGERGTDGRIVNTLRCWTAEGEPFTVKAPLDSGRSQGTFDLVKDGDKVN